MKTLAAALGLLLLGRRARNVGGCATDADCECSITGHCVDTANANFIDFQDDRCRRDRDEQCACNSNSQCQLLCMNFEVQNATHIVENILMDPNGLIEFRNITSSGTDPSHRCFEYFTNGRIMGNDTATGDPLLPDKGVIMGTGLPRDFCWDDSRVTNHQFFQPGDPDLDALPGVTEATRDACWIEFEFRCLGDSPLLSFNYVFGSDEYTEHVNTNKSDAFAFFLDGVNVAVLPDGATPVSIDNVNPDRNAQFFIDNADIYPMIEADGFTTKLNVAGNVTDGWNTLKMVVADVGDHELDSYVLIEASSLTCVDPLVPSASPSSAPSLTTAPSSQPSESPSVSDQPTSMPSESPSISGAPSGQPSEYPSLSHWPTSMPSESPSISMAPSSQPSESPSISAAPSSQPSESPSVSDRPTSIPSESPSISGAPSGQPSAYPSLSHWPTSMPSESPSISTAPSSQPSKSPSISAAPSSQPSESPSVSDRPTSIPSESPSSSGAPSGQPSEYPSLSHWPTSMPSESPSLSTAPSGQPSDSPSTSAAPTSRPSEGPSVSDRPTSIPSESPSSSGVPSSQPSEYPSLSHWPTSIPSESPSLSAAPTRQPSESPSSSTAPSSRPSERPSVSDLPTSMPSESPSTSSAPSGQPSEHPSVSDWPTSMPSESPSLSTAPSSRASESPSTSAMPSIRLSRSPSISKAPSGRPSDGPSVSNLPTLAPSESPSTSGAPSGRPSEHPSVSDWPTSMPSESPSASTGPSSQPFESPSASVEPSSRPSGSDWPTSMPSESPSVTSAPSVPPSLSPSDLPTSRPSSALTGPPSMQPSISSMPSGRPSKNPSSSAAPSVGPSVRPSISAAPSASAAPSVSSHPSISTAPSTSGAPTPEIPGVINGTMFLDANQDGVRDPNDDGLPGVVVGLWCSQGGRPPARVAGDTTDSSGVYTFVIAPGTTCHVQVETDDYLYSPVAEGGNTLDSSGRSPETLVTSGVVVTFDGGLFEPFAALCRGQCDDVIRDCGWGVWNTCTCQCDCDPGFCLSSNQKCYDGCTSNLDSNNWGGCRPGIDCPWYPDKHGASHCTSSSNFAGIYNLHETAEKCCMDHFSAFDTNSCVRSSVADVEAQEDLVQEKLDRPRFYWPDLHGKQNCVFDSGYAAWMEEKADYYLFDTDVGCCGLWYPSKPDCPEVISPTTPLQLDHNPDASLQFYYPRLSESNCGFGRNYPMWMKLSPEHYLYSTSEECCRRWYPSESNCPLPEDDGVQEGFYWQVDEAFYPNFKGDSCARGNSYPEWMADPAERDAHIFKTGEDCCNFWFPSTTAECQSKIVTVIDGKQIAGPDVTGTWYPSLNGLFQCIDGTPPSWMTESEGYKAAYVFDSHAECCKAHFCEPVRDIFS